MEKVYCIDCKHWDFEHIYICNHPDNLCDSFAAPKVGRKKMADEKNADNNCRDFEAKV